MTTYQQEMKQFLSTKNTNELVKTFMAYFDMDYFATELIRHLERTKLGRNELRKFIIKTFADEQSFLLSELEEIFAGRIKFHE